MTVHDKPAKMSSDRLMPFEACYNEKNFSDKIAFEDKLCSCHLEQQKIVYQINLDVRSAEISNSNV